MCPDWCGSGDDSRNLLSEQSGQLQHICECGGLQILIAQIVKRLSKDIKTIEIKASSHMQQ